MTRNCRSIRDIVPECLRLRLQWVCWKYVTRKAKVTKCPHNARTGRKADSTKPETWSTFDEALAAYETDDGYAGIGYVFAADDPYCGIDLDDCIDPATGDLKPWGRTFVDSIDSYTEISPSGEGVKAIVEATKPGLRCKKAFADGEVEMYDCERFFTITGNALAGSPLSVNGRQEQVEGIYTAVFGKKTRTPKVPSAPSTAPVDEGMTDDDIVRIASRARRSGEKFQALWLGNWSAFKSQSEADSSLVFRIAFYTKDATQIDRIFRCSGLMRDKWDEQRGGKTYGQLTIDEALEKVTGRYRPRRSRFVAVASGEGQPEGSTKEPTTEENGQESSGGTNEAKSDEEQPGSAEPEEDGSIPLGQRDPATGRLVLSPKKTLPTARAYVDEFYGHHDAQRLRHYAGIFMTWRGNQWVEIEEGSLRHAIQPWLHASLRYVAKRNGDLELVPFESNPGTVKSALDSLKDHTHLPVTFTPACWLDYRVDRPDPRNLLPYPTGTLDLVTNRIISPTPMLFNVNAIDFNYDPNAKLPQKWYEFLSELWPDDAESIALLQQWMGYCLVADTSLQKMLLLVGPRRSGKGTIGRVMNRLIGTGNVVGPTTNGLAGDFGLQPLIGKSLAVISDARFTGPKVGIVVERLLNISGEDPVTIDRKFLTSVTMKLPTRIMVLTNELPRMNDASGALAGRFMVLRLVRSFYGKENTKLTNELMDELPGILVWAISGLRTLRANGRFIQPKSAQDAIQEMEDLASPVLAFVRDCCEVKAGLRIAVDELYAAWKAWCEHEGRDSVSTKQTFGRDLAAAVAGVKCRKNNASGRFYEGIGLIEAMYKHSQLQLRIGRHFSVRCLIAKFFHLHPKFFPSLAIDLWHFLKFVGISHNRQGLVT